MKTAASILLLIASIPLHAQELKAIDQSWMNVTYKLPIDWETDGFGSVVNNFDGAGSSVCECAGTINFGPNRELGMVIYPFNEKSDTARRNSIWNFRFIESPPSSKIKTKKITFLETRSAWKTIGVLDNNMLDDTVLRYNTQSKGVNLVIYFWGDPNIMFAYEKTSKKFFNPFRL